MIMKQMGVSSMTEALCFNKIMFFYFKYAPARMSSSRICCAISSVKPYLMRLSTWW